MSSTWPQQAVDFFAELERHNERSWWQEHRLTYDHVIKPAFVELLDGVSGFGPWRLYRPNNDVRFGAGKGAYKTFIGAVAERADGVGVFVQVSSRGLLVGTGIPMSAPDQLQRLRSAVADEASGPSFVAAVERVSAEGGHVFAGRWDPLRRVPRGYPADHPRAHYLRWKGVEIGHRPGVPVWLAGADAPRGIDRLVAIGAPLHDWLGQHVGVSALTPEERFAPGRRRRNVSVVVNQVERSITPRRADRPRT